MVQCGHCKAETKGKRCVCGKVSYCGENCQRMDWARHKSSCPLYVVREVPGKGRGTFATRKISPGRVIMEELPLLTWTGTFSEWIESAFRIRTDTEIESKILSLKDPLDSPSVEGNLVYPMIHLAGLTGDDQMSKVTRIAFFNNVRLPSNSKETGLYHQISLINHSCNPNAVWTWVKDDVRRKQVRAIKTIRKNEEICTDYLSGKMFSMGLRKDRIEQIVKLANFICRCTECSLQGEALEENENARREYLDIKKDLPQLGYTNKKLAFRKSQRMVDIVRKLDLEINLYEVLLNCHHFALMARQSGASGIENPETSREEAWKRCQHFGEAGISTFREAVTQIQIQCLLSQ